MILTALMFVVEAIEEALYSKDKKKMPTWEKGISLLLSPIWPIFILLKTSWKQYCYETSFKKPKEDKEEIEKLSMLTNRAHLIEVCIESSLQPLIQLHVILKLILNQNLIDGKSDFDWTKAMEAFWERDLIKIFKIGQQIGFNPQVKQFGNTHNFKENYSILLNLITNLNQILFLKFVLNRGGYLNRHVRDVISLVCL